MVFEFGVEVASLEVGRERRRRTDAAREVKGLTAEVEEESVTEEDPKEEREGDRNIRPPRGDLRMGEGPEIDLVSALDTPPGGSLCVSTEYWLLVSLPAGTHPPRLAQGKSAEGPGDEGGAPRIIDEKVAPQPAVPPSIELEEED